MSKWTAFLKVVLGFVVVGLIAYILYRVIVAFKAARDAGIAAADAIGRAAKQVVTEDLNPASANNVVYRAANVLTGGSDDGTESLGTRLYDGVQWLKQKLSGGVNSLQSGQLPIVTGATLGSNQQAINISPLDIRDATPANQPAGNIVPPNLTTGLPGGTTKSNTMPIDNTGPLTPSGNGSLMGSQGSFMSGVNNDNQSPLNTY